jgi:hypothetical protein
MSQMGIFPNMMGMDNHNMGSPQGNIPNQPFPQDYQNMQYFQNMYSNQLTANHPNNQQDN